MWGDFSYHLPVRWLAKNVNSKSRKERFSFSIDWKLFLGLSDLRRIIQDLTVVILRLVTIYLPCFTLILRFFGCSRYSYLFERSEENRRAFRQRMLSYLTRFTRPQPRAASFIAYFHPDISNILFLICCSAHLKQEVIQDLENRYVTFADGYSMEDMIPGEDKAFVFLSGGIRPFDEEDENNIYLRWAHLLFIQKISQFLLGSNPAAYSWKPASVEQIWKTFGISRKWRQQCSVMLIKWTAAKKSWCEFEFGRSVQNSGTSITVHTF